MGLLDGERERIEVGRTDEALGTRLDGREVICAC
jgi:hypothetical protein